MPFAGEDLHINLFCGIREDGHWHGFYSIDVRAEALRELGLHPDQRWSEVKQTAQPAWWRAEALRLMLGGGQHRRSRRR